MERKCFPSMFAMMLFRTLPIFCHIFITTVFSRDLRTIHFIRQREMDNMFYSQEIFQKAKVKSRLQCLSRCNVNTDCIVALHNPVSSQCGLYSSDPFRKDFGSLQLGWQSWRGVGCGKPDGHFNKTYILHYTNTQYGSRVQVQCGLGEYTLQDRQSVCQKNGQWSKVTLACKRIPYLRGSKTLPDSVGSGLKCRTVMSDPVPGNNQRVNVTCNDDEIMTGCSGMTDNKGRNTKGSSIQGTACQTYHDKGGRSVALCCQIPGLKCEYIPSVNPKSSVSCYKNFQLFDCSCFLYFSHPGPCPTEMTNTSCNVDLSFMAGRYATCCTHDDLFCYVKKLIPKKWKENGHMIMACGHGEVMTACSVFNSGIQATLIKDIEGVDQCEIFPGSGNSKVAMVGYVTCCKHKAT